MKIRAFALALVASVLCSCAGTTPGTGASGSGSAPLQPSARSQRNVHPNVPSPFGNPTSVAIPAVGQIAEFTASEAGATFSASSSNPNIVTVTDEGTVCPKLRRGALRHRKPQTKTAGECFVLTGMAPGTATVTLRDGLGASSDIAVIVQIPILLSISTAVSIPEVGDTLTFTAGVNAPNVELSASSSDPTIVSVAPAANGVRDRRPHSPEAAMTTNQRFTLTGVRPTGTYVTVSSTDPKYSPMSIFVFVNPLGESFAPYILILNQGEAGYMMPVSSSFDETVSSVTTTLANEIKITRPFANSPIFNVAGIGFADTGQITINSNKGSYLSDYVWVQPISSTSNNLAFPGAGQTLSFTVSEAAAATFMVQSYDTSVATVTAGAATSGATSTQTFSVHSTGIGQTDIYVNDNLGYEANIDVIVGNPFTTTPSSLSFTAIGQEKNFTINLPQNRPLNDANWIATAASSNESVVKVTNGANQWTAKAIGPGHATIYVRDSDGSGDSLGEMISFPVDVTATGGVIH